MKAKRKSAIEKVIHTIKSIPQNIADFSIVKFCEQRFEKFGFGYKVFAVFAIINYILPYFMWEFANNCTNIILRFIAGASCVLILLKEYWPDRLQKYFGLYWHITILYSVPLITSYMLFSSSFSYQWLINLSLRLLLQCL